MLKLLLLVVLAVFLVTKIDATGTCICYQFVDNWDGLPASDENEGPSPSNPLPNLAAAGWTPSLTPQHGSIMFIPGNLRINSATSGAYMTTGPTGHVAIVTSATATGFGWEVTFLGANQGCTGSQSGPFGPCMTVASCSNVNYASNMFPPYPQTVYYYKAGVAHLSGNVPLTANNSHVYAPATGPSAQPSSSKKWEVPVIVVACVVGIALVVGAVVVGIIVYRKRAATGNETTYQQMRKPLNNNA